ADKTLRILSVQARALEELSDPTERPLATMQWAAVLRSCQAYEAYQRLHIGRGEPERILELLLLHPSFPRSVRFCLEATVQAPLAVGGGTGLGRAERILGRVLADLKFLEIEQVLQDGLDDFVGRIAGHCAEVSRAVQEHYAVHA